MLSIKTIGSIGSKFMASDKDVSFVSFPIDFVTLVYYGQGLSRCTDMIRTHDNSHPIMLYYLIKEKRQKESYSFSYILLIAEDGGQY